MSGTTNNLVEISDYFYKGNNDAASNLITTLQQKYSKVINELLQQDLYRQKATQIIGAEFNVIRSFANKKFDLAAEKSILARGEIMSTNLVQLFHEEMGIKSVLLNALDFMRVDADGEPIPSEIENQ